MRKIVVLTFVSLDGVMQAPGGKGEDPSGGFELEGWTVPFFDDVSGAEMGKQLEQPFDLLLGRKTYDIFAGYWPKQDPSGPVAKPFNKAVKYVASNGTVDTAGWKKSIQLKGDVVGELKKIKAADGPMLQVHGSGNFNQTLFKNDLVDELWLKIYPVTLGKGKRLFAEGTIPANFKLIESTVTPSGVIFASYRRDGDVKTGSFD